VERCQRALCWQLAVIFDFAMSAFADCELGVLCCYVQGLTCKALFDHLISAQHDRRRYRKAERRGGLAVRDHLEFCRELHRKVTRLRSAQDAIHISGGTTKEVYEVDSVQTALSGKDR